MSDMTDPSEAWPTGLAKLLKEQGCESLADLLKKKVEIKLEPAPQRRPVVRMPYVVDQDEIPD